MCSQFRPRPHQHRLERCSPSSYSRRGRNGLHIGAEKCFVTAHAAAVASRVKCIGEIEEGKTPVLGLQMLAGGKNLEFTAARKSNTHLEEGEEVCHPVAKVKDDPFSG